MTAPGATPQLPIGCGPEGTVTKYADLVNTLEDMAGGYAYSVRKGELREAARTIMSLERELAEAKAALDDARYALAGLADGINQELRENGPHDDQIAGIETDMRPFVRRLVDRVRAIAISDEAAKDKARYDWIIGRSRSHSLHMDSTMCFTLGQVPGRARTIEEAIDAAMKEGK